MSLVRMERQFQKAGWGWPAICNNQKAVYRRPGVCSTRLMDFILILALLIDGHTAQAQIIGTEPTMEACLAAGQKMVVTHADITEQLQEAGTVTIICVPSNSGENVPKLTDKDVQAGQPKTSI